jgi:uncharacterized protein YjbJ (UPF0337 family)
MQSSSQEILSGKWHELKGKVKQKWGKLTDDEVTQMSGRMEELAGVLQQRYGYDKGQAEQEINQWLKEHDGPG